jgi:hypothetical protein
MADVFGKTPLDLLGHPVKQGICDLCGEWDGHLQDGIGSCCRERVINHDKPPTGIGRPKFLPVNNPIWTALCQAQAALVNLDEAACLVQRVEIGRYGAVMHLARAPGEGIASGICELVRTGQNGQPFRICRARFGGVTLEWSAL